MEIGSNVVVRKEGISRGRVGRLKMLYTYKRVEKAVVSFEDSGAIIPYDISDIKEVGEVELELAESAWRVVSAFEEDLVEIED